MTILANDGTSAGPHRPRRYSRPDHEHDATPQAPQPDPEPEEGGVPEDAVTVPEVKAWVGDDIERAEVALAAEQAKDESDQRATLLDYLEGLITEPDPTDSDEDADDGDEPEDEPSDED